MDSTVLDETTNNDTFEDQAVVAEDIMDKFIKAKIVLKEISVHNTKSGRNEAVHYKDYRKAGTENRAAKYKAQKDKAFEEEDFLQLFMSFKKFGQRGVDRFRIFSLLFCVYLPYVTNWRTLGQLSAVLCSAERGQ